MRGPYKIVLEKNLSSADCKQRPQFVGLKGGGGWGVTLGDFLTVFSLQASDDLTWLTLAFSALGTKIFDPTGFLHF